MTEYTQEVEKVRIMREAEVWAKQTAAVHVHSLSSMHYDNRPEDTANGKSVTDIEFQSGIIKRYQNGEHIHTFGHEAKGDELYDLYTRR
jgi:hypothetical protein